MTKLYKVIFANDALTQAFFDRSQRAATAAGGTLWISLNFDSPDVASQALMDLPDTVLPDDIIPLPVPSTWTFVEEEPA